MGKEDARIDYDIDCLDTENLRATLISTLGAHCDVWQTAGYHFSRTKNRTFDMVIKCHTLRCHPLDIKVYQRDYFQLKHRLHDIIPEAVFVRTRVDGEENMLVLAQAFTPWFNLANPAVRDEAIPLMAKLPKARRQLALFIEAAQEIRNGQQKIIDLYGLDNLVLDKHMEVRYLDSFAVFFYEDLPYLIDSNHDELTEKIEVSLKRLAYLKYMLASANQKAELLSRKAEEDST